jgi:DUF1680 family protein
MRKLVATILDRIATRQRADGYSNYYPENDSYLLNGGGNAERKNYDRVFWTRGLIDAGAYCDPSAFRTLRRFYDWFNSSPYLGTMLLGPNATNGHPGGGLVYFTPVGKSDDIAVTQRFFDEDYWIDSLRNGDPLSISYYPGQHPHTYELLNIEAFVDEYRATGDKKYLAAVLGAWKLYRENFEHVGGAAAICEGSTYPPRSYYLTRHCTGETCGNVFWVNINSRLLQLYPDKEVYAAEIEKSIYNVLLACQDARGYIRYHNYLHRKKDGAGCSNTCCEVSSTAVFAKLPEYIYSISADGIYVNLFAASSIAWKSGGGRAALTQQADFPFDSNVRLVVDTAPGSDFSIHIRVPSWATGNMAVLVNSQPAATGAPGSYLTLRRVWKKGDEICFALPLGFSCEKYTGLEQSPDHRDRYALLYGPILMALVIPAAEGEGSLPRIAVDHTRLSGLLKPKAGSPLHFEVAKYPQYTYMPYWQVQNETFSCFPVVEP